VRADLVREYAQGALDESRGTVGMTARATAGYVGGPLQ
jgi:hypothetical protein